MGQLLVVVLVVVVAWYLARDRQGDGAAGTPPTTPAPDAPAAPPGPATPEGPAAEVLASLTVLPEGRRDGYEREAFGNGWGVAPDGCDVREHVLAAESRVPAARGPDGCSVSRGDWLSLYDGYSTPDPDELEIDHLVPLAEAWESGAAGWSDERREAFANDLDRPDALVAVTAATNRSKADGDPADWLPPDRGAWCRYAGAWVTQKAAWGLTIDPAEHDALANVLATC
ncbi:MAG TPA: HNH endonuclease family protein [Acidimicrobiales bacterium]